MASVVGTMGPFAEHAIIARLYRPLDAVTRWAIGSEKRPLAYDARDLPFDVNEVCGLLSSLDEGDVGWHLRLQERLLAVEASYNLAKWGDAEAPARLRRDLERLVGWTVTMHTGPPRAWRLRAAEERLKRAQAEYDDAAANLLALKDRDQERL